MNGRLMAIILSVLFLLVLMITPFSTAGAPKPFDARPGSKTPDILQSYIATSPAAPMRPRLEHPNGWLYPAGSSNYQFLSWLCFNSQFNGYHLAQDMSNPQGDPVYAIDYGQVIHSACVGGYGGPNGDTCGGAVSIQHRTKDGTWFTALYGHLDNYLPVGTIVYAGDVVGFTNNISPAHVHFGIRVGVDPDPANWFRGYTSSQSNPMGFTKPVAAGNACISGSGFLETNLACKNGSSVNFRPNSIAPIHPNGTLVKSATNGTIFVLRNGQKQGITSPEVLRNLYPNGGFDFKDVITIAQDEFNSYPTGSPISSQLPSNGRTHSEGRLIKRNPGGEISIVTDGGMRRPFPSADVFLNLGYLFCNVADATASNYDAYPVGPPVTGTSPCNSPASFSLSSPTDGQSFSSGTTTVTLSWTASANANSYDVYFGTNSNPPLLGNQPGTSRQVTVQAGQTYWWTVVAKVNCGTAAFATPVRSFSVQPVVCNSPGTFSLNSPSDGQTFTPNTTSVTLSWNPSTNASSYDVYFGTNSNPPFLANQPSTSRQVTVQAGQTYSWKVVARVDCGSATFATPVRSFVVSPICNSPGGFSLVSPTAGQSLSAATTTVTLSWGESANANSYDIYFGTTSNPPFLATQSGTSRQVNVQAGQTYWWKVIAKSDCTSATATTNPQSFSVQVNNTGNAVYDAVAKAPKCGQVGNNCDSGTLLDGRDTISAGPEPNQPNTINTSCPDGISGTYHVDESIDRIKISTVDNTSFASGKSVKIEVTVWAWTDPTQDHLDLFYSTDANNPNWTYLTTLEPTVAGNQTLSTTFTLASGSNVQAVRAVFRFQGSAAACGPASGYDDHDDVIFATSDGSSAVNYALATNGAVASVSSTFTANYPASNAINGERAGANSTTGGILNGWASGSTTMPQWLQVDFSQVRSISEVDVFTVQDNYQNPATPTLNMTFTSFGLQGYDVQYWNGSSWLTIPGASVSGNNKVWRQFTFTPISTSRIRVLVNATADGYSRITEVEAWASGP